MLVAVLPWLTRKTRVLVCFGISAGAAKVAGAVGARIANGTLSAGGPILVRLLARWTSVASSVYTSGIRIAWAARLVHAATVIALLTRATWNAAACSRTVIKTVWAREALIEI